MLVQISTIAEISFVIITEVFSFVKRNFLLFFLLKMHTALCYDSTGYEPL
jgi:hypothetical protein